MGERTRYEPGTFCWVGLAASDPAAATAFYTRLLGSGAGRVAAIQDPTGAVVSLWQPRPRIGATLVNDVGALCWNELATTDAGRAKSFFGELLGWQYQTSDTGGAMITNAGRRNGSIRAQTGQERGTPPHWLPYFTVENADDAARHAAQAAGARSCRPLKPAPGASR